MTLGEKQRQFTRMIGELIEYAYLEGYELTFGDAYRDPRVEYGHEASLHRKRLAVDFNLFKDGEYLTKTEDHEPLGEFWESIGGSWGGRFDDGNHYSLAHGGMR
jgi:hypothetical protein